MSIYETKVKGIGTEARLFKEENMIILFGLNAPDTLKDYCFNIMVNPVDGEINPGMTISFNQQFYQVTAVGDVVAKNLNDLGHVTIKFDGETVAELPGTLHVEQRSYPEIDLETTIVIN